MTTGRLTLELIAMAFATGGVVDYWRNGSIFTAKRATYEAREDFFARLMSCSFCMNGQTPLWLLVVFFVPSLLLWEPWSTLAMLPVYWLAIARAAWLINVCCGKQHGYDRKEHTHNVV